MTTLRIRASAIEHNLRAIRQRTSARIIAVVKEDGYGLGLGNARAACLPCGVDFFAVGTAQEALRLKEMGGEEVLLLTPELCPEALEVLIRIKSCLMPIYVVNVCTFFVLRAGGDTFSTMLIDSGYLWVGPVTISTLLSIFTPIGVVPLYITIELLDLVKMFVAFWFLKRGRWVRNLAAD